MVGREAELQHLSEVFEAVRRGTALGAIVTGEAGIGKTRLLDEFVGSLPDEVVLARGQCWDTGVPGSPFVAVRGLLRDLAAHVGVETLLAAGGASGHRLATVVPELHRDPADRSSGPVDRDLLHDLVGQVLSNLAARAPVVAVVEDLHWADAASLDLLRAVVNTVRAPGLMLLASSRTEHPAVSTVLGDLLVDLERHRGVSLITVERLSPSLVSDLARQIAGKDLAADALGTLVDRSEGVPFFVEELLGLPSLDGALPGTARGLLLARYLRLDESTQELVRVLAAGGTRVEHSVVTQVLGPDPAGSDSALRQAVSAQVVSVDGTAYTFRHALLREAVYDEMLPGERLRVHAGYARALAAAPGGDSRLAEIAHHWWSAQDHPRALEATVRAAERARAAGAYATAGTLGERALDLWSLVPDAARVAGCQRLDLLLRTVDDYVEVDHPRALTLVDAALAECPEEDHRHRAALLHLAWVFRSDNGLPGAREAIEQAVALLPDDDHGRREDVTWLQVTCGWGMELMHSDVRRAQDVLQDVVAVGRALLARGDPGADTGQVRHELARSLTNLGTCRSMLGDLDGAFAAFDEALEWGGPGA